MDKRSAYIEDIALQLERHPDSEFYQRRAVELLREYARHVECHEHALERMKALYGLKWTPEEK